MEERLQRIKVLLSASTALALAACSGAAQLPPKTSSVNTVSPSYAKLQFAVGTANIFGVPNAGMNVVSTFRQTNGTSAVLVDTPAITGPFTLPAAVAAGGVDAFATAPAGPSDSEVAVGGELTGTTQSLRTGSVPCDAAPCPTGYTPNTTTFGQSGGVFGMGLQPANSTNGGTPFTYTPYSEPLFDGESALVVAAETGNDFTFTPWGGPPAYDPDKHGSGVRDGINDLGNINGVNEGLTTFEGVTMPAASSTYTMTLTVPTGISSTGIASYGTVTATATASGATVLPAITTPVLAEDGTGGGTFALAAGSFPAGVTEVMIQVTDYGPGGSPGTNNANCQGPLSPGAGAGPVIYTVVSKTAGAVSLPDAVGPNLDSGMGATKFLPGPTLCTAAENTAALGAATPGDAYSVQIIGFDYPAYEASPIFGGETPTIVGAAGQADITIGIPLLDSGYGGGVVTVLHSARKPATHRGMHAHTVSTGTIRK
jgi:hypothetical protein